MKVETGLCGVELVSGPGSAHTRLLMTHTALTIGGLGIHCDRGDLGLWCGQDMI